jgi:hypothetical protein
MKAAQILMMNKSFVFMTFTTNKNGTFAPFITTSDSSVAIWEVSGEPSQTTNTPSFTLDGTDRTVNLKIADFSKINLINFIAQNIKGELNLSLLTNCTDFQIHQNTEISSIINPTNTTIVTRYDASVCSITSLNISNFANLGNQLRLQTIPNLISLILPASTQTFTQFYVYDCDITGTLDLSDLIGLSSDFRLHSNPNFTGLILPTTSNNFSIIYIYGCNLGVIDWSPLSGSIASIRIENNNFTSAESDENIVGIDTYINLTTDLNIAGTNGALTDGSVTGFDGLAAKDQLIIEGISVTYN